MKKNTLQRGFAVPVIIAVLALLVLIGGSIYFLLNQKPSDSALMQKSDSALMQKEATITLSALDNSGQGGKATLSEVNGKAKVVISVTPGEAGLMQPAHIHMGTCPTPGAVVFPLNDVVDGKSETVIDASIETLAVKLPLAINVHKSKDEANNYVACGNLSEEQLEPMIEKVDGESMMKKEEVDGGESMMKYSGSVLAGSKSPLIDFSVSDYEAALKTDKLIVLYFYANWCPICKAEVLGALYPAFHELTNENVIGFRVNYNDSETDSEEVKLAKQFGVAYQHTKVFVKNDERVLKSPESWNKNRYFSEINKYQ